MFCPKCGRELPDGSTFCPWCGAASTGVANVSQPKAADPAPVQTPAPAVPSVSATDYVAAPGAPKRSKKPLILGGIAVVAVAAVVAIVLFATGVLGGGGTKSIPNGRYSLYGIIPYDFRVSGDAGEQTLEFVETNGGTAVLCSGTLVPDGSNSYGTIWRVEDIEFSPEYSSSSTTTDSIRVQFPESIAEGDPTGTWYLEISESNGNVMYSVVQFSEDGTVQAISSSVHLEAADLATSVLDDALSAEDVFNGVYQRSNYRGDYGFSETLTLTSVPNADPLIHVYYLENQNGELHGIVSIQLDE